MSTGPVDHDTDGDLPSEHPLVRFIDALDTLLDETACAAPWTMSPTELREVLPRLSRLGSRLSEVTLRVLAQADRQSVGDDVGATNTPAWFAHLTGQPVPATHAMVTLAAKLDEDRHRATREALAAGRLNPAQATVVLDAIDALPAELVDPALKADAEAHLVGLGDLDGHTRFDPKTLRTAGRKILEVLAPRIAEAHEAAVLEAEERQAAATATFSMRPDGHGSMLGKFKIPLLHGQILAKHLDAIAAPRHQRTLTAVPTSATTDPAQRVAKPLRWGQAFTEYLETRDATGLPRAGGVPATLVVTMTQANLLGEGPGAQLPATLDTGDLISAATSRRLACEAGIIPAVLGSKSQPLDLGRKTRFHNEPQRIAITLRDGGCATLGCDWPPGMCHVHHKTPWAKGGNTSVDDGVMLCPRHHTLAHDARYQLKTDKHGKVTFTRRR